MMIRAMLLILPLCLFQESDDVQDATDALLGTVDLAEWDDWFRTEAPDIPFQPSDFVHGVAGTEELYDSEHLIDRAGALLLTSAKVVSGKLILLVGLGTLSAALCSIQTSGSVSQTAETAFRISTACTALLIVAPEIRVAYRMLGTISQASERVLPVLIGYLTLCGMEHTSAVLTPMSAALNGIMLHTVETAVIPIGCIGGVLTAFDACANGRVATLGRLLMRTAKILLGGLGFAYGVFGALNGITASNADGLLLRTAKLAAGSLPAVGGIVSDSVDTAFQCMVFVKNVLGLGCAAMLFMVCIGPILRVFFLRCSFRAAAAVSEPLSGRPYADLLHGLSELLHILMLSQLAAAAMALTMIAPVLAAFRYA